jgi:CheY-like chemotaxis protein
VNDVRRIGRLLVIADDTITHDVAAEMLAQLSYDAVIANNGLVASRCIGLGE